MALKTYEDGSEITVTGAVVMVGACVAVTAVAGATTVYLGNKISDFRTKRWLKKHDYPQHMIDRY